MTNTRKNKKTDEQILLEHRLKKLDIKIYLLAILLLLVVSGTIFLISLLSTVISHQNVFLFLLFLFSTLYLPTLGFLLEMTLDQDDIVTTLRWKNEKSIIMKEKVKKVYSFTGIFCISSLSIYYLLVWGNVFHYKTLLVPVTTIIIILFLVLFQFFQSKSFLYWYIQRWVIIDQGPDTYYSSQVINLETINQKKDRNVWLYSLGMGLVNIVLIMLFTDTKVQPFVSNVVVGIELLLMILVYVIWFRQGAKYFEDHYDMTFQLSEETKA